jgi:hypothetical protein
MRKELLIIALGLCTVAGKAAADVLTVPEGEPIPEVTLPAKGSSMGDVEKKFGEPRAKQPTVGGDTPKHPPITRWDYDGFVVVFERDKVIDAVIPGAPPPVVNKSGLRPAVMAPAMPDAVAAPAETTATAPPPAEVPSDSMPVLEAPKGAPDAPDAAPDQPAAQPAPAEPANMATPENPNPDAPPAP